MIFFVKLATLLSFVVVIGGCASYHQEPELTEPHATLRTENSSVRVLFINNQRYNPWKLSDSEFALRPGAVLLRVQANSSKSVVGIGDLLFVAAVGETYTVQARNAVDRMVFFLVDSKGTILITAEAKKQATISEYGPIPLPIVVR